MELINKTDANLNIALIAKNKAKSDAQKALMGRVLFMMDNMPTIEAIPKDQYETRLKADLVAMLEELDLTIDEIPIVTRHGVTGTVMTAQGMRKKIKENIQQKINNLKGDSQ